MPLIKSDEMSDAEIAYVAGIFDGEGCIGFAQARGTSFVRILITNTNKELLEYLQSKFGGDIKALSLRKHNWKQGWNLRISWSRAIELIRLVYPWLRVKREQAQVALAWDALRPGMGKVRYSEKGERDDAIALLREQMTWLNKKGGAPYPDPVSACLMDMGLCP